MELFFENLGVLGLFLSAFISSTIAPGGSEAVLAYLVVDAHHDVWVLVAVASLGNTLGALTTWWLGTWASVKFAVSKVLSARQQKAIGIVKKWGVLALLLSWLPVVGDGLCFAAGWLRLPLLGGVIAIAAGKIARYSFVVFLFE
ncbi:MAG TPA: DedA family protein [Methylococcaceae bacterium]|jgi:membrane protein YqaA with SNARE-associated domain|nr:DedA family protein [Methylococcaceae bacterium]HIA44703.1 DedA family protein [Methylococcaceae bacterium]HIB62972.1 DedA family protein [Methylococcaceae bacterium]HIO44095.1 DedA family protein [Methylococcales bacterium]